MCHGEEFASAVSAVWRNRTPGLAAVGVNCTHPKFIGPLLQTLIDAKLDAIPVVVYPNSGEDWDRSIGYVTFFLHLKQFNLKFIVADTTEKAWPSTNSSLIGSKFTPISSPSEGAVAVDRNTSAGSRPTLNDSLTTVNISFKFNKVIGHLAASFELFAYLAKCRVKSPALF